MYKGSGKPRTIGHCPYSLHEVSDRTNKVEQFLMLYISRTQFDVQKVQLLSISFSDAGDAELRKLQKLRLN